MNGFVRAVFIAAITFLLPACIDFKAEFRLNPDGSGTLNVVYSMGDEAIARQAGLTGLGRALGGSGQSWAHRLTFEEGELRSHLEGLEIRSITKTKKNGRTFMHAEAAFGNLDTLARSIFGEAMLFERLKNGAVRLHIDTIPEELPSPEAPSQAWRAFAGLEVAVKVTVPGTVVSTNAHQRNKGSLGWRWAHHGKNLDSIRRIHDGADLVVSGEKIQWTLPRLAGNQVRVLLDRAGRLARAGSLKAAWHTLKAYEKIPAKRRTPLTNRRFNDVLKIYRAEVAAAKQERFYFQCANRALVTYKKNGLAAAERELDVFHERFPDSRHAWKIEAKRDFLGRHARGELTDLKKTFEAIENHIRSARFGIARTIIEGKLLSDPVLKKKKETLHSKLWKAADTLWKIQHAEARNLLASGRMKAAQKIYHVIRNKWGLADYQRRAEAELARLKRSR